ncbi:MAG: hypothetical protein J5947_05965, partial [Clostridium sp.]|nr:hypothetical protein [Clostridium sp.]
NSHVPVLRRTFLCGAGPAETGIPEDGDHLYTLRNKKKNTKNPAFAPDFFVLKRQGTSGLRNARNGLQTGGIFVENRAVL